MAELSDRLIPIDEAASEARLAVNLILKLLANLRRADVLDDETFSHVAASIIIELGSDQERFRAWGFLEELVPDFERPDQEHEGDESEKGEDGKRDESKAAD